MNFGHFKDKNDMSYQSETMLHQVILELLYNAQLFLTKLDISQAQNLSGL